MGEVIKLDLKKKSLRDVNSTLQNLDPKSNLRNYLISNPSGNHAVCAGLKDEMEVTVKGHVGYYCAGMNQKALVTIEGNVGTGVAENMMSGKVHVKGNASQSAGDGHCCASCSRGQYAYSALQKANARESRYRRTVRY